MAGAVLAVSYGTRKVYVMKVYVMVTRVGHFLRNVFVEPVPDRKPPPAFPDLPSIPAPNLALALDLSKQAVDHQADTSDGLDTKAGFVLASASLLVAVLMVWRPPSTTIVCTWALSREQLIPHLWLKQAIYWGAWLILLTAILVYALVIYFAGRAYSLRQFDSPPEPSQFVTPYPAGTPEQEGYPLLLHEDALKRSLLTHMITAYGDNAHLLNEKVQWLQCALRTFWLEAGVVGLVLLYETVIASHMK